VAKAEIVVFLEPHVIVNKGWLEPLITHVEKHPRAVAMPMLDQWNTGDKFSKSTSGYYRFEWNFNLMYARFDLRGKDDTAAYPTPATSGGIFAIRTDWFAQLELYDTKLEQWGGDHIELAFKAWRCGGRIDMIPCSHVAHVFRNPEERPYEVDVSRVVKNYKRLAEIWLEGDNLEAFYNVKPEARSMDAGDTQDAISFKERLKCHSHDWYLTNIDWEMKWEKKYVCIPGYNCEYKKIPEGRCCIDREMPSELFEQMKKRSRGFFIDSEDGDVSDATVSGIFDAILNQPFTWVLVLLVVAAYFLGRYHGRRETQGSTNSEKMKKKKR